MISVRKHIPRKKYRSRTEPYYEHFLYMKHVFAWKTHHVANQQFDFNKKRRHRAIAKQVAKHSKVLAIDWAKKLEDTE